MKFLILLLFPVIAVEAGVTFNPQLNFYWETFKTVFRKDYAVPEELSRRLIFEKHVSDIVHHNLRADLGLHSFKRGLNEFIDMSHEEFKTRFLGLRRRGVSPKNGSLWVPLTNVQTPKTMDWREEGLVTPVKNQDQCGACWSFSAIASLEGQNQKKTGELVPLSEQNLVDCSGSEGNQGCDGGWITAAFEYIKNNNGVDTEESYPYIAQDDTCHFRREYTGANCTGYVEIPENDEEALYHAVATVGPVSVGINASPQSFQTYSSGIWYEPGCSSSELNHAVAVVGYGTEDGVDYWLCKNSFGTSWGMNGYIKMPRNKNNHCGIASLASYPLV